MTVGHTVEYTPHSMETIQVVLDSELLRATDAAAKRARLNRSAVVRKALREHLRRIRIQEMEARDRRGYEERPSDSEVSAEWERAAQWPEL